MSRCNLCRIVEDRKRAKLKGEVITLVPAKWGMGGLNVFMHPKGVKKAELTDESEKYSIGWVMEIPERCSCD